MLFNSWTPYVSKFDTSTFYNWEQDNVPLYDLEERTYELWEQGGFATSAGVPGLALTVSADTPQLTLDQNSNIFTDVSSAIAAIPKVVRFPVLVEVANFGDLGPLELHNFRIEEGGSIEIINRNFGRAYNASSIATQVQLPSFQRYQNCPIEISSLDLSNTLTDTSCVHLGQAVFSSTEDPRLTAANFALYPSHVERKAPLCVSIADNAPYVANSKYDVAPYEAFNIDQTLQTLDISSTATGAAAGFMRRANLLANENIGGNFYGNACTKISVQNCDGPIYVRNFFVDSNSTRTNGIEVKNSKVVLENCTSVRGLEAGFKFINSDVILSRSAFSYRNYSILDTSSREPNKGVGFHAVNSNVNVSSTILDFSSTDVGDAGAQGRDAAFVASRNTYGFVLENSKLQGGVQRSSATNANTGGTICSEFNTSAGMRLHGSYVDVKGLLDIYGNNIGIEADNSFVTYENLTVDASQEEGLRSKSSTLRFDSSANMDDASFRRQLEFSGNSAHLDLQQGSNFDFVLKPNVPGVYGNSFFRLAFGGTPAVYAADNSNADLVKPHIEVSSFSFTDNTYYGRAVKAINNSVVTLNGTKDAATSIAGSRAHAVQKTFAATCAENNSTLNFHGPTVIAQAGVDILAQNNSVINIEPRRIKGSATPDETSFTLSDSGNHTSVELHSTRACIVANKNSTVNMRDLGAWPANWPSTASGATFMDDTDYTLQSSGSVSAGSIQFYANPQDDEVINNNDLATAPFTAPLSVTSTDQINAMLINRNLGTPNYTDASAISIGGMCVRAVEDSTVNVQNVHFPFPPNSSPADGKIFNASGSECERFSIWNIADNSRLNASYISVSGMHPISCLQHGPSALWASSDGGTGEVPASGAPAGTPDTGTLSILDAFGQGSAVWHPTSGTDFNQPFDRFYPVSGAMNTETASALSEAGVNVSGTPVGFFGVSGGYNNRGWFRIYWSTKPSARLLANNLSGFTQGEGGIFSGVIGAANQIFAQGYNNSGSLSALPPTGEANASSVAPDLLKLSRDTTVANINDAYWTSGFYYCSEFVEENPTQCMLDESAADTFANARNASIGLAGRPRKTTIYKAGTDRTTESYQGDTIGGLKSTNVFDLSRDN